MTTVHVLSLPDGMLSDDGEVQVDLVDAGHDAAPALDLTVQSAAYAAEDSLLSGAHSVNLARTSGQGCILDAISVVDNIGSASETPELHVMIFDGAVASAPGANASMSAGAGPVLPDADLDNLLAVVEIGSSDYEQIGEDAAGRSTAGPISLPAPSSGVAYGVLVKTGTALTAVASRDMRLRFHVSQD